MMHLGPIPCRVVKAVKLLIAGYHRSVLGLLTRQCTRWTRTLVQGIRRLFDVWQIEPEVQVGSCHVRNSSCEPAPEISRGLITCTDEHVQQQNSTCFAV